MDSVCHLPCTNTLMANYKKINIKESIALSLYIYIYIYILFTKSLARISHLFDVINMYGDLEICVFLFRLWLGVSGFVDVRSDVMYM